MLLAAFFALPFDWALATLTALLHRYSTWLSANTFVETHDYLSPRSYWASMCACWTPRVCLYVWVNIHRLFLTSCSTTRKAWVSARSTLCFWTIQHEPCPVAARTLQLIGGNWLGLAGKRWDIQIAECPLFSALISSGCPYKFRAKTPTMVQPCCPCILLFGQLLLVLSLYIDVLAWTCSCFPRFLHMLQCVQCTLFSK